MNALGTIFRRLRTALLPLAVLVIASTGLPAQQWVTETRDPKQTQDEDFAKAYKEWTGDPMFGSPLVDHLPKVSGIPTPKDVLGYHIGAPRTLTYYENILKYYRALAAATPRVKIETIGKSDENRELVVVWVSSDANITNLQQNRANLARLADPRGVPEAAIKQLIATTKPHYHFIGGLHSGEFGPPEMLMELVYRLATETSPFISTIRDNVIVSVTPVADTDGRDRNVDLFYCNQDANAAPGGAAGPGAGAGAAPPAGAGRGGGVGGGGACSLPYWGKYVYHDNNRDINLSQIQMRALADWYFTAHPPIMHDLHEAQPLLYTYSGGPPQNPNLDPILFAELPFFSNWELAQMTKWGMPGVYTHAFMDGWSPGYLGSVAYNHNGMMRMYETQSGRDGGPAAAAAGTAPGAGAAPAAGGRAGAGGGGGGRGNRGGGGGAGGGGAAAGGGAAGGGAAAGTAGRGGETAGAAQPGAGGAGAQAGGPAGAAGPLFPGSVGRGGGGPGGAPGGGRGGIPTGRGGGQDREWYRGIPIPPGAQNNFTRRNNTNYMQTGVLSGLQLTAMFPNLVIENFYTKTRNSIEQGKTTAPFGYVIPVQRDMTRPTELVRILRVQGIEVGQTTAAVKIGETSFPAGSFVIKGGQPYWRLAKNLLERQDYPDPALRTYDDSGWSMGHAFNVDVKEIRDKAILDVAAPLIKLPELKGKITGTGTAGLAIAHFGSNNMITFRYKVRNVPMKVAEKSFTVEGVEFPAGSYIVTGSTDLTAVRTAVEQLGLTAAAFATAPTVATHDGDVPRVAIYSQWNGTQELGWYRHAFDQFGIPFELIYKERVTKGNLKGDFDVIVMAAQNINRTVALATPAARPSAYVKTDKFKFLGMYGETTDTTGGFGQEGVDAFAKFLEAGGTIVAADSAVRFPIEFGFARSIDTEGVTGVNAQKPLVQAEIVRTDHPAFYGYADRIIPIKYASQQSFFRVGPADQANILARFVGGDAAVLSGLMVGGDAIRGRAFAVDVPNAHNGKGRVIMFSNNPVYRWQNHGEFNMIFNSILNWNDVPAPAK
ncbi:MAG TPA: M14 family zinc carboxypeptidase [Vicinamibacterales bacterium]|nr:M14 family zinc carboxypeptidase [Vicinamibacterales bacterium]